MLNGFNDYACPDVPENLAVTLSQLRARGDYLDDVQLTEEGRWLILYGDNGVLWNDIPQELEQTLREYNEAQEIITSVAFNDAGDWIVVSKSRYAASSPSLTRWIAEGIDEYGALWTAHMTEDGTVLCFENGYLWRGNVPGIVQQKLRETTLDAYRVKFLSDGTYFIADQDWKGMWNFYSSYANNTLHMASLAEEEGNVAMQAMALTLKVLFMSNLTDMFGDIPYSEAFQGREEGGTKTPKYDSQQEVYEQMIADLEKAKEYALDVCRNSGIELLEDYADLFKYSGNNNRESLLAMQWVENGQWGVCNTLLADLAFSTAVTGGVNVWGGPNASPDMLKQYESGDTIRRDATFFTEGAYYDYICKDDGGYRYEGTSAPIKKGVIGGSEDNGGIHIESMNCPINTYILRLADVYLTLAEACLGNQESLNSGEGLEFFNKVRTRAKMPSKPSITLDDIIRERRVEFAMEYCNWYDMVSWYSWKPEKMLTYFNEQHRGWTASYIKSVGKDRSLRFYSKNDVTSEELEWGDKEPSYEIEVTADDIFLPYPESDVIQNPLLNEPPVDYEFNE